jgi:hypothetical protein
MAAKMFVERFVNFKYSILLNPESRIFIMDGTSKCGTEDEEKEKLTI